MTAHPGANPPSRPAVKLRHPQPSDVATLFAFESDPAWGAVAMVKPRTEAVFRSVWAGLFEGWAAGKTDVVQKVILADGEVCGSIGCRLLEHRPEVGYGLGRPYWGRGIASEALGLLLLELPCRPLFATAAATNVASLRILNKHGFQVIERRNAPETERCLPRDEVRMMLAERAAESS